MGKSILIAERLDGSDLIPEDVNRADLVFYQGEIHSHIFKNRRSDECGDVSPEDLKKAISATLAA